MNPADVAELRSLLREIKADLAEVKVQAKMTNGRVTALEREQIKREERERMLAEFARNVDNRQATNAAGFRWRIGTLIAAIATTAAVSALVTQLVH